MPLDVENDLLTRFPVLRPPLILEHGCDFWVIDMATIAWLIWRIQSVEHSIRVPGIADGGEDQALELPEIGRRHIGAVLLDLQFRLDANLFERALSQLCGIDEGRACTRTIGSMQQCFESFGNASLRQQTPGLLGIVLIIAPPRAKLINARRPFGQTTGDRRDRFTPDPDRVNDLLAIDRM